MKSAPSLALLATLLLAGCGKDDTAAPQKTNTASGGSGGVLSAPADYVGALANSRDRAIATTDLASLRQAIQIFNVNEGRFPKDLDELVSTKMIGSIPPTPRGKKLAYNPATGDLNLVDQ